MFCTFTTTCPHCLSEQMAFSLQNSYSRPNSEFHFMTFSCNGCFGPIVLEVRQTSQVPPQNISGSLNQSPYARVIKTLPEIEESQAPINTPDRVARSFLEALDNQRRGNLTSAAMMFRRTLEQAIKAVDASLTGSLFRKIEKLKDMQLLTPAMSEWAHAIRLDGNEGAHGDDEIAQDVVEDLHGFTELFLLYQFTLPQMLEAWKKRTES